MAFFKPSVLVVIISLIVGSGVGAYYLVGKNRELQILLETATAKIVRLEAARIRDAEAASRLISSLAAEKEILAARLKTLSEITDEEGRTYLDASVPASVRRLLNTAD